MDEVKQIKIDNIVITKDNPRQTFDEEPLKRLGESIRSHGLIQPIIVRPKNGYFELVIGERRLRAAQLIGLTEIEAKIEDIDDATCMELRLIENTHREDLTEPEKGEAVFMLWRDYPEKYPTYLAIAEYVNKSEGTIQRWLRASQKLSDHVKELLFRGTVSDRQTRAVIKFPHSIQNKLIDVIARKEIPGTDMVMRKFIQLYESNPDANPDDLADEAMGIKKVEIDIEKLTPEARREVEEIIEEKRELLKKARKEALEKGLKAPRRKTRRIKPKPEVKERVPTIPSVPPREETILPTVEALRPEVEKIPERPETKGVVLTALVPTDLFTKVTSLAAERRTTLGETVTYIIEQFFKWRDLHVD